MSVKDVPILTNANVYALASTKSVRQSIQTLKIHRIFINYDNKITVDKLFDILFAMVGNSSFCPTNVKTEDNCLTFCVQKCASALDKLFKNNLVLKDGYNAYYIKVQLCYQLANNQDIPSEFLHQLFNKRFNLNVLNLEGIASEITKKDIYMSPNNLISIGAYLYQFLFASGQNFTSVIRTIRLNNNGLKDLQGIKYLLVFTNLTSLYLRNNLLGDVSVLEPLNTKSLDITDLWLDGNPLCDKYTDEASYIKDAKSYCNNLVKLDGTLLKTGLPQSRRNFVCDNEAAQLVDQFMEHYFTVFDICRKNLVDLYDANALFSLSSSLTPTMLTGSSPSKVFSSASRNILRLSDITRGQDQLHKGAENIIKFLDTLPKTQHDPYTFTIDIVQHDAYSTTIMVTGMFRVFSNNPDTFYNFSRTFRIIHCGHNKFKIFNELLAITNSVTNYPKGFTKTVPARLSEYNKLFGELNSEEKKDMCKMLSNITEKSEYVCEKYLISASWDMKAAINLFIKDFTSSPS
ncbi:nuclear RNA export factor 1-like [Ctenocephalides felis]|uniref:nuclear RNA export factor 1-like n=1 Tax=Ctenocephalides felis TaxID=7515 RepID=UPI000E6E504B|nr:nuclear RNA export factor 1-like [Ctenocephalides felis]